MREIITVRKPRRILDEERKMAKPEDFLGTSDKLLAGSYDMHMHAWPEFSLDVIVRMDNEQMARSARDAGMGGIIFKSHFWPTTFMADVLNKKFAQEENNPNPDFRVFGSIVLNDCSGGIQPYVVEAAIELDARMVWMPTWSAKNDIDLKKVSEYVSSFLKTLPAYNATHGTTVVDGSGKLTKNAFEVLELCRDRDVALSTGHIAKEESLVLAQAAHDMGFKKLVFTHPDSTTINAEQDVVEKMAELGAYIELCALGLTAIYHRITPQKFAVYVHAVGADKCVLSTDYFHEWAAPLPEQMRMLINSLMYAGVSFDEVRQMAKDNAAFLLGVK
jgi:hypothetical protein